MKKAVLLLIFLVACTSLNSVNMPVNEGAKELSVSKLDNGLTITVEERHALPLVTIQFWIHVGGKNEPWEHKGIAHLFEHIWFKGTETQPVGSFHKRVEALGGELNAMTSYDWTMYFVTVPSDKFDDIFPYMVDLLKNPAFNETEIEKEKEVVVEEQRFSYNEPEKFVDDQFGLLLIDEHPYKVPVIGFKDTIKAPTREQIVEFYNTWYVPNNMNVVISGDITKEKAVNAVKTYLGDLQPRNLPALNLPTQTPQPAPKYNTTTKDVDFVYIGAGYLAPNSEDEDKYAMMALNTILSNGDSSRINAILKKDKNLIVRGQSYYVPLNDLGVFETIIVTDKDRAGMAKAELLLQFNKLKSEPVTQEELSRAKAQITTDLLRSQEEIFQVGFDAGKAWIDGDITEYTRLLEEINKVTAEDIQRVAQKYFQGYTMVEVKPKL